MRALTPDLLLQAYCAGLFPMGERREDPTLYWLDPDPRTILPLNGFHLARRLARTVRSGRFEIRCDSAFETVIEACAEATVTRRESWINRPIVSLYTALFERGHAHSVETWHDGHLVGGLYGVSIGGAFFGESMFSRETDASKVALVHLVARLVLGGYALLDCQFMTAHLRSFGAVEVPKTEYRWRLQQALRLSPDFQRGVDGAEACAAVLQASTMTS
jgi:leucyl/phenylalanyl-tRNA--protein transferase